MSIIAIRATFDCDGCGKQFGVHVDPAIRAWERRQAVFDIAEDAIRGGTTTDGDFCSIQADMHLCGDCTAKADAIGDDEHVPTRAEILEAIGAA